MRLRKQIKWKLQRLWRALLWPVRAWHSFWQLIRLVGYKGVFWHMVHQGRWHFYFTVVLCLLSLPFLYHSIVYVAAPGLSWSVIAIVPVLFFIGGIHYALWRASSLQSMGLWLYTTRLYVAPVLILTGVLGLTVVAKLLFYGGRMVVGLIA